MTKRFQCILRKGQGGQKRNYQRNIDKDLREQLCHKCGRLDHFIMFRPLWALECKKKNPKKVKETSSEQYIPKDRKMTNQEVNSFIRKTLEAMGNSSGEESD